MSERDLAYAVMEKAITDATGKVVTYETSENPTEFQKRQAIMFLRGYGHYREWLKYWCDALGWEVSEVIKFGYKLKLFEGEER